MVDPVTTLTSGVIANLAFKKFTESVAGELAKKFSTNAIAKMDLLLKRIWAKLGGKPKVGEIKKTIEQSKKITSEQFNQIVAYIQVAMDEDCQFAADIQKIATEINAGKFFYQKNITQSINDQGQGWQTNVEGGTAYIGEIHIQGKTE